MTPKNVDDYISMQDEDKKDMLQELRKIILSTAPKAQEQISYMVPYYKYHFGLVGFGAQKKGCSFYTMNPKTPLAHKADLNGYKFSGSTIQINLGQKIPTTLIKKIIKERIKENETLALSKKKK